MSLYNNGTSRIYPDLNPIAPPEPQAYRLKLLTEIEEYLLDEIEVREELVERMKIFNTIMRIMHTGLITSTVITGRVSIAAFASGVGLLVGNASSGASLIFSALRAVAQKSLKILIVKQ